MNPKNIFAELKRRNVYRAAVAYGVVAWFLTQLTTQVFGRWWYVELNATSNAIDYAKFRSCSHEAVIRVYDAVGNVIDTHEHIG